MLKFILACFSFGVALSIAAAIAAGAGHGSYTPIIVVSAPLAFVGIPVAFFGEPLLWALIGFICWRSYLTGNRTIFITTMILQYATAFYLTCCGNSTFFSDYSSELELMQRAKGAVIATGLIYFISQIGFWLVAFRGNRVSNSLA